MIEFPLVQRLGKGILLKFLITHKLSILAPRYLDISLPIFWLNGRFRAKILRGSGGWGDEGDEGDEGAGGAGGERIINAECPMSNAQ
ncbi:hypothetical protein FACHB389_07765 [Nostoc calcicola FACHB-389]|nr:hypothetical protein FACHB389_07765 [Nostoc calcicola FACHB-389]